MDICKANHSEPCIRCMPGACGNRKTLPVPMPHVVEPKKSIGSLKVDVGINGMDETIKQLQVLKELYTDIDTLQQRIIEGAERVNQIVNGITTK